MLLAIHVLSNL